MINLGIPEYTPHIVKMGPFVIALCCCAKHNQLHSMINARGSGGMPQEIFEK